jgi:hypothetical protein
MLGKTVLFLALACVALGHICNTNPPNRGGSEEEDLTVANCGREWVKPGCDETDNLPSVCGGGKNAAGDDVPWSTLGEPTLTVSRGDTVTLTTFIVAEHPGTNIVYYVISADEYPDHMDTIDDAWSVMATISAASITASANAMATYVVEDDAAGAYVVLATYDPETGSTCSNSGWDAPSFYRSCSDVFVNGAGILAVSFLAVLLFIATLW